MEKIRTDIEIVSGIRDGDETAFNELIIKYGRSVRLLALKRLGPFRQEVDDITQEVFIKVWEKRKTLRTDLSIHSFLYTITVNACLDRIEMRKVYLKNTSRFASNAEAVQNPEVKDEYLWKELIDAIEQLPKAGREVVKMHVMDGKSYDEIVETTGMKIGTARNFVSLGRNFLRKKLKNLL